MDNNICKCYNKITREKLVPDSDFNERPPGTANNSRDRGHRGIGVRDLSSYFSLERGGGMVVLLYRKGFVMQNRENLPSL